MCAPSSCGEQRPLFIAELFPAGTSLAVEGTSLAVEHTPGEPASVVAALQLSRCGWPALERGLSRGGPQA